MDLLQAKTILVCGASGKSGQAAARLAASLGAQVLLSDLQSKPEIDAPLVLNQKDSKSQGHYVDLRPRQDRQILSQYPQLELIIIAPGLPNDLEILRVAAKQGIPIRSENDFGFVCIQEYYQERSSNLKNQKAPPYTIAITGTDGKSTTTAMLTELIRRCTPLRCVACGNFGKPLSALALEYIEHHQDDPSRIDDVLVVECSSFQLERIGSFHPQTALFLNFAHDHGERYAHQSDYLTAKLNITNQQDKDDLFIVSEDLKQIVQAKLNTQTRPPRLRVLPPIYHSSDSLLYFDKSAVINSAQVKLQGVHNLSNFSFALSALEDLGSRRQIQVNLDNIKEVLTSYSGLPHRLEHVKTFALRLSKPDSQNTTTLGYKVECYNDSKATTIQAVKAALKSFVSRHIFLLCGGRMKGSYASAFANLKAASDASLELIPFGESGPLIAAASKAKASFPNLESAFAQACNCAEIYSKSQSKMQQTFVILLSPGCASFDAYRNYSERGEHFRQLVNQIKKTTFVSLTLARDSL